ncbi:zf-HC2 domain-containing protein [Rubrivivax sp. A210]|uniref:zf-HC2 domain-containing protein n=1 Tax=Rubrivivax sp. A210 TaxID=2772301 RepID=UPI0019194E57|nr:zf-HC2 domain-containing protein [Rubrivivax sp. A210]CAD5371621.1 zf-HC2 domain-containing protein [Rubrivivax sp. A210]
MADKLTCREVSRLLSDGLDQALPPPERARLRLHLVICDACREVEQQFTLLRQALRKLGSEPDDGAGKPGAGRNDTEN